MLRLRRCWSVVLVVALVASVFTATDPADADEPSSVAAWFVGPDGNVLSIGLPSYGDAIGADFGAAAIEATPAFDGYWLLSDTGEVQAFGAVVSYRDLTEFALNEPPVDLVATASGPGYWIVAADGGVFAFGDAKFLGSLGGLALVRPIVAIAPTASGLGYWLFAADGGVFAFGDARFSGSVPEFVAADDLVAPITTAVRSVGGSGYLMISGDGGVFSFGDSAYRGSVPEAWPGLALRGFVSIVQGPNGGYLFVDRDSGFLGFDVYSPNRFPVAFDTIDAVGTIGLDAIVVTLELPTHDPIYPEVGGFASDIGGGAGFEFQAGWDFPGELGEPGVRTDAPRSLTVALPRSGTYTFELSEFTASQDGCPECFRVHAAVSVTVLVDQGSVVRFPLGTIVALS